MQIQRMQMRMKLPLKHDICIHFANVNSECSQASVVELFVKTVKGALYGLKYFFSTGNPLKKMKNVSYFTLKALFVLNIFKFCLDMYKNGLIRKISLILKFMTSQLG